MKMNPMPTNRCVLTWLCAYPPSESTNKWMNWAHVTFTATICVIFISGMLACTMFVIEYVRTDLEIALNAIFPVVAVFGLFYMVITIIFLRHRIRDIFEGLKNIYRASEWSEFFPLVIIQHFWNIVKNPLKFRWRKGFVSLFGRNKPKMWMDLENVCRVRNGQFCVKQHYDVWWIDSLLLVEIWRFWYKTSLHGISVHPSMGSND